MKKVLRLSWGYVKFNAFPLFSLALLAAYVISAYQLPSRSTFFPQLIITYVFIPVLLGNIIYDMIGFRNAYGQSLSSQSPKRLLDGTDIKKYIGIVLTTFYIVLIPLVGFYICTAIFLLCFTAVLERQKYLHHAIYILVMDGSIYILFERWLGIDIPRGILF